jgi:hypothetical protein
MNGNDERRRIMKNDGVRYFAVLLASFGVLFALFTSVSTANEPMKLPPARQVPGLTAADPFPNGCVDCHINMPERKQDERISTLMARWNKDAGPKLLQRAQAAAPAGMKLKGKHPNTPASLKNIPAACMSCHGKGSKSAPSFSTMLHVIHYTGGEKSHYLTIFQGECTHCHKMDAKTGAWTMPSGPEK